MNIDNRWVKDMYKKEKFNNICSIILAIQSKRFALPLCLFVHSHLSEFHYKYRLYIQQPYDSLVFNLRANTYVQTVFSWTDKIWKKKTDIESWNLKSFAFHSLNSVFFSLALSVGWLPNETVTFVVQKKIMLQIV